MWAHLGHTNVSNSWPGFSGSIPNRFVRVPRVRRKRSCLGHAAQGYGAHQNLHQIRARARLCCAERRLGVKIKSDTREAAKGPLRPGVDFPTMAELNALIDNASGRLRPFIVTAIFTGMRLSELRGLRWSDVDLHAGVIHVRQRANAWGTMGPPKSRAGKRDIPLAPIVINTLRA